MRVANFAFRAWASCAFCKANPLLDEEEAEEVGALEAVEVTVVGAAVAVTTDVLLPLSLPLSPFEPDELELWPTPGVDTISESWEPSAMGPEV